MAILDTMFREIRNIIQGVTIKYSRLAKESETIEMKKDFSRYLQAVEGADTFDSYPTFDIEAIKNSKITQDIELMDLYASKPHLIPDAFKHTILKHQRQYIVENYEEKNEYYRKMIGLPPLNDSVGIYPSSSFIEENKLAFKPVHEYTDSEFIKLRDSGEWKRLIDENPEKEYLQFIGTERINLIVARQAENFQILKYNKTSNDVLNTQFTVFYEQNRRYMMSVLYNQDYNKTYHLYDNYMGMMLMVMVIQRILVNAFKNGIERDFYDQITLSLLFESYNVPFIESLPLHIQQLLAKNLNKLLHYKSTDKVIYDVASILGFERANIYRYLLIKEHRLDENGDPLFLTKTINDPEFGEKVVPDYDNMYRYYFQTVDISEYNVSTAIQNNSGRIPYADVVNDDAFWWTEDYRVMEKLHEEEFNYLDTKYLKMDMMYRMSDLLFEVTHFFRLLYDQDDTKGITIHIPRIGVTNTKISYFEAAVLLAYLTTKKMGMRGEILYSTTKIMTVKGFDFKFDITAFINMLTPKEQEHPVIKRLARSITHMDMHTAMDINKVYLDMKDINTMILRAMDETNDIEEYNMLYKLQKSLFTTINNQNVFQKSDGELAETFAEYLEDINLALYNAIKDDSKEEIDILIDHIIYRMEVEVGDLEYIHTVSDGVGSLSAALIRMIRFFKSYTIDMTNFNIIYVFNDRTINRIKIIDQLKALESEIDMYDSKSLLRMMDIAHLSSQFDTQEKIGLVGSLISEVDIFHNEKLPLTFILQLMDVDMNLYGRGLLESYMDTLKLFSHDVYKERIQLAYDYYIHTVYPNASTRITLDEFMQLLPTIEMKFLLPMIDVVDIVAQSEIHDKMKVIDKHQINSQSLYGEALKFIEWYQTVSDVTLAKDLPLVDTVTVSSDGVLNDGIVLRNTYTGDVSYDLRILIHLHNEIHTMVGEIFSNHTLFTVDEVAMVGNGVVDKTLGLYDAVANIYQQLHLRDKWTYHDKASITKEVDVNDSTQLVDSHLFEKTITVNDRLDMVDRGWTYLHD